MTGAYDDSTIIFACSGRTLMTSGAGHSQIGLGADGFISDGYDNELCQWPQKPDWAQDDWEPPSDALTPDEQRELCDIMIARWQALKTSVEQDNVIAPARSGTDASR